MEAIGELNANPRPHRDSALLHDLYLVSHGASLRGEQDTPVSGFGNHDGLAGGVSARLYGVHDERDEFAATAIGAEPSDESGVFGASGIRIELAEIG